MDTEPTALVKAVRPTTVVGTESDSSPGRYGGIPGSPASDELESAHTVPDRDLRTTGGANACGALVLALVLALRTVPALALALGPLEWWLATPGSMFTGTAIDALAPAKWEGGCASEVIDGEAESKAAALGAERVAEEATR